jgi:hypothetical protein
MSKIVQLEAQEVTHLTGQLLLEFYQFLEGLEEEQTQF